MQKLMENGKVAQPKEEDLFHVRGAAARAYDGR